MHILILSHFNAVLIPELSYSCYILCLSSPPSRDHPSNGLQITKLVIT